MPVLNLPKHSRRLCPECEQMNMKIVNTTDTKNQVIKIWTCPKCNHRIRKLNVAATAKYRKELGLPSGEAGVPKKRRATEDEKFISIKGDRRKSRLIELVAKYDDGSEIIFDEEIALAIARVPKELDELKRTRFTVAEVNKIVQQSIKKAFEVKRRKKS